MKINSTKQVFELANQKYAWPGGYEMYFICKDGGVLCAECVRGHRNEIEAAREYDDAQWDIVAVHSEADTDSQDCDHCGRVIIEDWDKP